MKRKEKVIQTETQENFSGLLLISKICFLGFCSQVLLSLRVFFIDKEFATLGLSFLLLTVFGLFYLATGGKTCHTIKPLLIDFFVSALGSIVSFCVFFFGGLDFSTSILGSILCLAFSLVLPLSVLISGELLVSSDHNS
jgi:hypothetical protein